MAHRTKQVQFTFVLLLLVISGLFLFACSNDKTASSTSTGTDAPAITASKVAADSCKTTYQLMNGMAPADQDCLEFSYGLDNVLQIRRFNAAFNCCPDSFRADVEVKDGIITITENEFLTSPCRCLCLYDIAYSVTGLEAGTYTIKVIEPYVNIVDGDALLQFQVDLSLTPAGEFCVYRLNDPWGMEYETQQN